jgi:oligopeptide transport system permease protein
MMRRLLANRVAVTCGAFLVLVALFSYLGPLLCSLIGLDGTTQDVRLGAAPPSLRHPFGTDALGRDLLVRTMQGGRIALEVGLLAAAIATAIGVAWGAVAGFIGGVVDEIMMRAVDVLYALPTLVFVIVVRAVFEAQGDATLFILLGCISWLTMARIVRGQILSLRRREFALAARGLGASPARILWRHLIPNTAGTVIVYATLLVPSVMLYEAFLSFLGLGVQAPRASWGTLIFEGSQQIAVYPWILAGPGALMAATLFALNFFGDALRDAQGQAVDPAKS